MKWLLWIGLILVAIVAALAVIGWLLPVAHTASRHAVLAASPSEVYAAISAVEQYPAWWSEISRVEMLPPESGRIRFREHMSTGPVVMEVQDAQPPSRFVTRIADADQPFGGTWTFDITPEGSGTRLTITERGEVYNPIFRFMSRFVFGYTGTMESCLDALAAKFAAR
jgi:uncharacterized protein YndB with AHSA1/START domain